MLWILDMWKPRQGRVNAHESGKRESSPSCPVPQSITLVRTRPAHDTPLTADDHRVFQRRTASRESLPRPLTAAAPGTSACGSLAAAPLHHRAVHRQSAADLARYTPETARHPPTPKHTTTAHNDTATAARTRPRWPTATAPSAHPSRIWTLTDWPRR
jgi:hypothetical protein